MLENIINILTVDVSGILVQIFFFITIILMVVDKQKPPIATSLMTGVALIVLGIGGSFYSPVVMILSVLNGIMWLILSWQRYNQKPIILGE